MVFDEPISMPCLRRVVPLLLRNGSSGLFIFVSFLCIRPGVILSDAFFYLKKI